MVAFASASKLTRMPRFAARSALHEHALINTDFIAAGAALALSIFTLASIRRDFRGRYDASAMLLDTPSTRRLMAKCHFTLSRARRIADAR